MEPVEDMNFPGLWEKLDAELEAAYGDLVFSDKHIPAADAANFPVRTENGDIVNSLDMSGVLAKLPPAEFGYIFADRSVFKEVDALVKEKRAGRTEIEEEERIDVQFQERQTAVLDVVRSLRRAGSWAGRTHIQKAVFLLREHSALTLATNTRCTSMDHTPSIWMRRSRGCGLLGRSAMRSPLAATVRDTRLGPARGARSVFWMPR